MVDEHQLEVGPVSFRYAVAGSGSPVLLLAGGGGWRLTYDALLEQIAERHTAYVVDPPGQGGTRVVDPDFGYDADAIADALAGFLDAVGIARTAVLGHSWGAGFALRLAELHPDRVERLALLAPGGLDVPDIWEFRVLRLPVIGELAARFTTVAAVRHMMRKSFVHADRLPSEHLLRAAADALRSGPDAARLRRDMLRVERAVRWTDTERDLGRVACPVLILWGEQDRYFPIRLLDRFTRRLPQVEVRVVPDAGHAVHDDVPDQTAALLSQFLGRAPDRTG
ncbi:alpha/beta fold hydrolase [Kribbella swartbergensis]